jgi:hypothetical protein
LARFSSLVVDRRFWLANLFPHPSLETVSPLFCWYRASNEMAEIRKGSEETARASNPMKDETFKPVADSKVSFISSRLVF